MAEAAGLPPAQGINDDGVGRGGEAVGMDLLQRADDGGGQIGAASHRFADEDIGWLFVLARVLEVGQAGEEVIEATARARPWQDGGRSLR